jgi:DNA-binding GntR family transcriptional regulator
MISELSTTRLVKHNLAELLREEILRGALQPGATIVEGRWALKFSVAQASIREAIHILMRDGFVTKESGRSARVIDLSEADVVKLYDMRGALEGLAARLAAQQRSETSGLRQAVDGMRLAVQSESREELLDFDLEFHLRLCELSQNSYLIEHARRILLPFFAFVRVRVTTSGQDISPWGQDLEAHQRILDLVDDGDGEVAELYVKRAMNRFARTASMNWERRIADGN